MWKKPEAWIAAVTSVLILYVVLLQFAGALPAAMFLFSISPFLIIAMVYVVIRYGKASEYEFNDRFYDDLDYKPVKDR